MRIRRFNENQQPTKERLDDIARELAEFLSLLEKNQKQLQSFEQELGAAGVDAVAALQLAGGSISTAVSKLDDAIAAVKKHDPYSLGPEKGE